MKALTLWQPYASFMVSGHKCYETRSWYPEYRGPIVVHAANRAACHYIAADAFFSRDKGNG